MLAVVPQHLVQSYLARDLLGGVLSLYHFQIEHVFDDYPRYRGYTFIREPDVINISNNTMLIPLTSTIDRRFPVFPLVNTIRWLVHERSRRRMMLGRLKYCPCFIFS